ncbi:MAG: Pycsar system effector family protein [Pyrinomonadaceae bacterium]
METERVIDLARDQLNRVLGFFPRVDAKISVLLSVDIAMLALLASRAPIKELTWNSLPAWVAILSLALIALSLIFLYQASFPRLLGGQRSLLYFRGIVRRKESEFIDEFTQLSDEDYLRDILSQIWRNSEILKQKYDYLKYSFIALICALPPWLMALAMFVSFSSNARY